MDEHPDPEDDPRPGRRLRGPQGERDRHQDEPRDQQVDPVGPCVSAEAGPGPDGSRPRWRTTPYASADAVLAATIFHFGTVSIAEVKSALADTGHPVR